MDFEFSDEQQELQTTVRTVLERECPISLVREIVEKGAPAAPLWAQMAELDWPALTIPEADGGLGLGFIELVIVAEELGRVIAPGPFLATLTQFAPLVREAGSPAQQERFLGSVARGEITGTAAIAEAQGSWAPADVQAAARRDGDGWVIDGTKHFVMDGAEATEIVVAARVTDGQDIGLFVVPGDAVEASPLRTLDASQPLATLELTGVHVPADRALGVPGTSSVGLERAMQEATAALAVANVGTCQAIFDMTLEYAKVREQFGVPIGSFQAVKHKLADMFIRLERARSLAYFAAMTIAEDDSRRDLAVAMAKAAAGDAADLIVQDGFQLHGGIGYTWEHDLHLYLKRARSADALLGNAALHRARVATLIGLEERGSGRQC